MTDFLTQLTSLVAVESIVDPIDQDDYKFFVYDSHNHYLPRYYSTTDDYQKSFQRFQNKNGAGFTIIGASIDDAKIALLFASSHSNIYCTAGLHPFSVIDCQTTLKLDEQLSLIADFLKSNKQYIKNKIVAIGECGISSLDIGELKLQTRAMKFQFDLALKYDIPIIIHAHKKQHLQVVIDELSSDLKKYSKLKGILHGFSADLKQLDNPCLDAFYISCNGVLFNQSSNFKKAVNRIGLNRILVETDSPMVKIPGCELSGPIDIGQILKKLADVLETDFESLRDICNNNFCRIYGV